MSFKHVILGFCVTAAALTATVTTVSAAGREGGLAARPAGSTRVASPAAAVGAAAVGTAAATTLFAPQGATSFEGAMSSAGASEEALPASSLALLALAALLSIGLLMTRRNGRA
jgi:hypothetical protein